jgi:hypothetical protein
VYDKAYVEWLCAEVDKPSKPPKPSSPPETYSERLLKFAGFWLALHLLFASIWYWVYGPNYLRRPSKGGTV